MDVVGSTMISSPLSSETFKASKSGRSRFFLNLTFRRVLGIAYLGCACLLNGQGPDGAPVSFTAFNVPGANDTIPYHVNDGGAIVGIVDYVAGGPTQGFLRNVNGEFITFSAPGDGLGSSQSTTPTSLNNKGQVTGWYVDANNGVHGFLRQVGGRMNTFDIAGGTYTEPFGISDNGTVTGTYETSSNVITGFARDAEGLVTTFQVPGATRTNPQSINSSGTITGSYEDSTSVTHGFVRTTSGGLIMFDPPGAVVTQPISIDDDGVVAGYYLQMWGDFGLRESGFLRAPTGTVRTVNEPGGTTTPMGLNDNGKVVGTYVENRISHGFSRTAAGVWTTIDLPGASYTSPDSINATGTITGSYTTAGGTYGGFLLIP
jgi:hypothetical protein